MASITEIHFNGDEKAITVEKDFNFVTAKLGNQEIVLQFTTVGGSRVAIRKDAVAYIEERDSDSVPLVAAF